MTVNVHWLTFDLTIELMDPDTTGLPTSDNKHFLVLASIGRFRWSPGKATTPRRAADIPTAPPFLPATKRVDEKLMRLLCIRLEAQPRKSSSWNFRGSASSQQADVYTVTWNSSRLFSQSFPVHDTQAPRPSTLALLTHEFIQSL